MKVANMADCIKIAIDFVSPDERCDVSLTGETTNTKHTHKRSEAQ